MHRYLIILIILLFTTIGKAKAEILDYFNNISISQTTACKYEKQSYASGIDFNICTLFTNFDFGARYWWEDSRGELYGCIGFGFLDIIQFQVGYSSISQIIYRGQLALNFRYFSSEEAQGLKRFLGRSTVTMFYEGSFKDKHENLVGLSLGISF